MAEYHIGGIPVVEEDGKLVVSLEPDDELRCTVWLEKGAMRPLRAELITDGRVTVCLEITDWQEGGAPAVSGDAA